MCVSFQNKLSGMKISKFIQLFLLGFHGMVSFDHDLKTILRPSGSMFKAPNQKSFLNNPGTIKFSPASPF